MACQATEVWVRQFEEDFAALSSVARTQVLERIRELGRCLETASHHRLQGRAEFRLRVGDYRVIYSLDPNRNTLWLHAVGHRREIYR
jgi:mRNA interferase RelE/StbE